MSEPNPPSTTEETALLAPRIVRLLALATGAYFLLRLLYFVVAIHHSVPPDEITHMHRVTFFSQFFFLPYGEPGDGNTHLWTMRYHPPLYYLLAGKFLWLNVFGTSDLVFTRLLSVMLSCGTVAVGWRFIKEVSAKPWVQLLFLVMLTNTMMFSVLSAVVNYDALVNLLAAASIYYMTCYFKRRAPRDLMLLVVTLLLAALTKTSTLPFCFAVTVAVVAHERRQLLSGLLDVLQWIRSPGVMSNVLASVVVLLLGWNVLLYGNNVLRFGHLVPKNQQVLSEEDIKSHPMGARRSIYVGYLQGKRSLEESIALAKQMEDKASSYDTVNLLKYAAHRAETEGPFVPMSRWDYAKPWSKLMYYSIFGVMGHSVLYKGFWGYLPYGVCLLAALAVVLFRAYRREVPGRDYLFLAMFLFYMVILMQAVNYQAYLNFQLPHISVQGRYLFPFLLPIYGLTATYLLSWGTRRVQVGVAVVVGLYFVYGDFPYFLQHWGSGPW